MRIIAGQLKARRLRAPAGGLTRPTTDRLRENLFNILIHADWAPALEQARVLDLFAGSGALGFEALSRGAAFALFVETARRACQTIAANGKALGVCERMRVKAFNAVQLPRRPDCLGPAFDIAFIDAPYGRNCITPCLQGLKKGGWIKQDGLAIVETGSDERPDFIGLTIMLHRQAGASRIWCLQGFGPPDT